ncbi:uncharacterized protein LOC9634972 isoform X2 [Selaginella moellendorffii]|uniref:uncharacterized protein LOC9634972 isoform X2 n=1 Tax=Selaginella moellendorffii TaxID=88036 RepID=UPI000D1C8DBA|nr:uncharacterized protein LOC9634972 isoform X2 [Selaginella moellendorffii]|eukprot:XP_024526426.1 uncharacterized protein LOC9634972 isoform X2 [Selaginella moellendorffii]
MGHSQPLDAGIEVPKENNNAVLPRHDFTTMRMRLSNVMAMDLWTRKGILNTFASITAISLVLFFTFPRAMLTTDLKSLSSTTDPIVAANCSKETPSRDFDPRVELLLKYWQELYLGNGTSSSSSSIKSAPRAPHLQNCSQQTSAWDTVDASGNRPNWIFPTARESHNPRAPNEDVFFRGGPQPPWIEGGDDDNLPMTRQAQTDLWLHQHPKDCTDKSTKFLVNDWVNSPKLGLGGQMVAMAGIFAIAVNEKRVLVTDTLNRADHDECKGSARAHWSCYFVLETSEECRAQAKRLLSQKKAWKQKVVTNANSYPKAYMWFGKVPEKWGRPWETMQPLDVVDGEILGRHKATDRQWWRAQALRYLMRAPSEYLCKQLNLARHHRFGRQAAELTIKTLPTNWPGSEDQQASLREKIWTTPKPWLPRPMLSVHVRQGDKASEMKIFSFKSYMELAQKIQTQFPQLQEIWLSTEMQNVIDESKNYTNWRFHYTDIPRQNGTTSMGAYERSLGVKASSNNAFVNFVMASECDFFVGALGSTWSFLIDAMRATGGKLRAGFLSVNKDRYW